MQGDLRQHPSFGEESSRPQAFEKSDTCLEVDSDSILYNHRSFGRSFGFRRFSRKKDPWKEWKWKELLDKCPFWFCERWPSPGNGSDPEAVIPLRGQLAARGAPGEAALGFGLGAKTTASASRELTILSKPTGKVWVANRKSVA